MKTHLGFIRKYTSMLGFEIFPDFATDFTSFQQISKMAGSRVAHATLKGPSVVKELCIGMALALAAGSLWKMHHWNEQRKVRQFYDLLEKGEISVVVQEE
ncbi:cytochrome c oxidase subunit 5C isoform X1 [Quercus suber]|uniref:cytochrome c oxidase subunit 5C isoform X1 n=1 Tax=Quercus suber TaxID=58331 RepID=UPI0032DF52D8